MLEPYKNYYYDTCKLAERHSGMKAAHKRNYGPNKLRFVGISTGRVTSKQNIKKQERRKPMKTENTTQDNKEIITHVKFFIAGVRYHQLHRILNQLELTDSFRLVPETREEILKYDPNAVRIEYNTVEKGIMCGYVPKKFSAEISAMISLGKRLSCSIKELNKEAKPWEQCKVAIEEVKDV